VANPHYAAPVLPEYPLTAANVRRYKQRLRAYDAARLELRLATPEEIQRENSIVETSQPRILEFES
jgi:hypothetical protein